MALGVPQGSTLGPLLFLLYINDIHRALNVMQTVHFADDTTLYLRADKSDIIAPIVNEELERLNQWLSANRLCLNVNKTTYMIVSDRAMIGDLDLSVGGGAINRVLSHRFLGVVIDERLRFCDHINLICGKISRSIGIMRRLGTLVPARVIRSLFYSFVYSYASYAITAWGSASSSSLLRIKSLVNRAIKMLAPDCGDVTIVCTEQSVLNFNMAYEFFTLVKMYNVLVQGGHKYFYDRIFTHQVDHSHSTRFQSNGNLVLPLYCKTKCQASFLYRGMKLWNDLPLEIRSISSVNKFKKTLKVLICNGDSS